MAPTFQGFPKIPRLNRDIIITEKIDGTNAAIGISEEGDFWCQSRTRIITPDNDNQGFARWAYENVASLVRDLGVGLHFGEWWGQGIGRKYGLDHKRFSLFNTTRWANTIFETSNVRTVPVLYTGPWLIAHSLVFAPEHILGDLRELGSFAAPGFMQPEGIVVYHTQGNLLFKATLEKDQSGKNFGA